MYRFIVARRSSTSQQTLYKNLGFCIRLSEPDLLAEALGTYASPAGLVRPPLPRLAYCGLRPRVLQGEVSPCEPLWPAFQLVPRLPNPIEHTRPRGIHAPGHSFGVIQTMLLALPNFGLERMGREKPQQPERFFAACGRMLAFGFARTARHIQYCRRSRCGLNRAYSTPK